MQDRVVTLDGYGYGDGDGDGYGSGYGYGDGYGDGSGYGYGDGRLADCGGHPVSVARAWGILRIGCECWTLDEWIENAYEIDARHGDGIAQETRALAMSLRKEENRGA